LRREAVIGRTFREVLPGEASFWIKTYGGVALTGESVRFEHYASSLKRYYEIFAYRPVLGQFAVVFRDITERKQAESEREMTVEFLRQVNDSRGVADLLRRGADFFQKHCHCEAVAIRLKRGEDYPYGVNRGFSDAFVQTEGPLCARDVDGKIIRDKDFNPLLDCLCGQVISGRVAGNAQFFTKRGNFWTNSTTELNASPEAEALGPLRNRCHLEGYESVALIALRLGEETLGLLQMNDRRPGRFSPELISLWERLAGHLAVALARAQADEALQESEERLNRGQEIAHLGSWELDLVPNHLTWSDEVYRIFGLAPQEFEATYEAFLAAVHSDDRAAVDAAYGDSLRNGLDSYDIEHRVVRKNTGEVRIVQERCQHIRDEAGRVIRSVGMVHDITERKQAEEQMAWLASFPRQNPRPVMEVEADGKLVYANPAAQKLLPDLGERGLGHPWLAGLEDITRQFREGKEARVTRDMQIGDSWYQQLLMPVQGGQRVRAYATDITARKQAEMALLRERNRMRLLADTAAQLLAAPDPLSVVKELCGGVLQFLDCQMFFVFLADEQSGRMHLEAYQGISEAKAKELEWLEHGTVFCGCQISDGECLEVENIGASGEPDLALLRNLGLQAFACHPIKIGGRVLGTLSFGCSNRERFGKEEISLMKIVADQVTLAVVRKRGEQALQEAKAELELRVQERTAQLKQTIGALQVEAVEREQAENLAAAERQRFNDVLETVPAYVVLLTPDYHVAYANRVFRERFGESGGRRCYEFLFQRSEPCEICETYCVLKTKGPHHWEWTGPDGRNYDVYDFPFTDTDGTTLILEMGIDITELKVAQQRLVDYKEKLEQLVEARTAALENTNAELLAAERARAKLAETLVSEIGHRTKNNLAIVAGLLQMQMDQEGENTPGPELIRDAVTRILSFASLHEQMYQSRADHIELVEALKRIAEIDRQALSAGDVTVSVAGDAVNYPSGVGTTLCVVANELLTNAIKHSGRKDGGRRLEVKLSCRGGRLSLSVWNSGKAIAKDFDIRKSSRTGLGLVRAIVVDQYGGLFTLKPYREGTLAEIALDDQRLREGH
jgi:PAS domain S-box-containing protein